MNHVGTVGLDAGGLLLRRLEERDAPPIYDMYSNQRVIRYLRINRFIHISQAHDFVRRNMQQYADTQRYFWVIEEKASGDFVGIVTLYTKSQGDEIGSVGYSLAREKWGRGYMAVALRAVLEFAFFTVGYNRIEALHAVDNPASGSVMRKAGMLYEGLAKEAFKNNLGYHDCHCYGLVKRDF